MERAQGLLGLGTLKRAGFENWNFDVQRGKQPWTKHIAALSRYETNVAANIEAMAGKPAYP